MTVHDRDSAPHYEALSYTWGDQKRVTTMKCNGRRLCVTENCKRALRALRARNRGLLYNTGNYVKPLNSSQLDGGKSRPNYIWIDAICINQSDKAERSAQVAIMAEIFRSASETVVYLGECPELDTTQGTRMNQIDVFKRRWFTRTWIVQEVTSSVTVSVLFDDRDYYWHVLEDTKYNASKLWWEGQEVVVPEIIVMRRNFKLQVTNPITRSQQVRYPGLTTRPFDRNVLSTAEDFESAIAIQPDERKSQFGYSSLLEMLERTRRFDCTDARDKLFAIISLFEQPAPALLAVDYSKTVEDVYTDLAWYFMQENNYLAMLFTVGKGRSKSIPSWVVDWQHDSMLYSEIYNSNFRIPETPARERNAGFWKGEERIYARREGRCVVIREILVDTLDKFSGTFYSGMHTTWNEDQTYGIRRYRFGPEDACKYDSVVVLIGFATPFVLRRLYGDAWKLLGACFVDELVSGEALHEVKDIPDMSDDPSAPLQDFRIC